MRPSHRLAARCPKLGARRPGGSRPPERIVMAFMEAMPCSGAAWGLGRRAALAQDLTASGILGPVVPRTRAPNRGSGPLQYAAAAGSQPPSMPSCAGDSGARVGTLFVSTLRAFA